MPAFNYWKPKDKQPLEASEAKQLMTPTAPAASATMALPNMAPLVNQQTNVPAPANAQGGAGGAVNYAQYYGANQQAANTTANKLNNQLTQGAKSARGGVDNLVATTWSQQNNGANTPAAPSTSTSNSVGQDVVLGNTSTNTPTANTNRPGGLPAVQKRPQQPYTPPGGVFTGPTGLAEQTGAKEAQAAMQTAEQNINQTGTQAGTEAVLNQQRTPSTAGGSRLDGALVGTAGSKMFDALRAKYGGQQGYYAQQDARVAQNAVDQTALQAQRYKDQQGTVQAGAARNAADAEKQSNVAAKAVADASLVDQKNERNTEVYGVRQGPSESAEEYRLRMEWIRLHPAKK
jgi:hypothetical protein